MTGVMNMPYVKKTERQTKPEGKAAVLSHEQSALLFGDEGFQSFRDRALFGICFYTTCRVSEACQLKISDLFTSDGAVKKTITFRRESTKGKLSSRDVAVHPMLVAILEQYDLPERGEYLFPGRHGLGHINPRSASNLLKEITDRLNLDKVSSHSFRRTGINRMRDAGVPLEAIRTVSGHASLDGLSHYLQVTESEHVAAVNAI
jgi:integrase/recombinase XerD